MPFDVSAESEYGASRSDPATLSNLNSSVSRQMAKPENSHQPSLNLKEISQCDSWSSSKQPQSQKKKAPSPIHSSWPRWATSTKSSSRRASCSPPMASIPAPKAHASNSPASLVPSSTAPSPSPRSSSQASRSGRSSPSKRPSSGSSAPPTPAPPTPKSKSARSLRWRNSHPSCPKSRSSTKSSSELSCQIRPPTNSRSCVSGLDLEEDGGDDETRNISWC